MSMNINLLRNAVIEGQISTLEAQIRVWEIYHDRTDEDVTPVVDQIKAHIAALEKLLTT